MHPDRLLFFHVTHRPAAETSDGLYDRPAVVATLVQQAEELAGTVRG